MSSIREFFPFANVTAVTAASTTGLSAGINAVTGQYGRRLAVTHFSGSVLGTAGVISTTALATIEAPANTVLWQKAVNGSFTEPFVHPYLLPTLQQGQQVVFRLSGISGSSNATLNAQVGAKLASTN